PGSAASCVPWWRTCCSTTRACPAACAWRAFARCGLTISRSAPTTASSSGPCSPSSCGCAGTRSRERAGPVKIERVEVRELALPLAHPCEPPSAGTARRESLLVTVHAGGLPGYGECVTDRDPFSLPETTAPVWHVLEAFLVPPPLGRAPQHPRHVLPALGRV